MAATSQCGYLNLNVKVSSSVIVAILQVFSSHHVCSVAAVLHSAHQNIPSVTGSSFGSDGRQGTNPTVAWAVCSQASLHVSG